MPKQPTCGHPDRKVFSKWDCKECASKRYAKKSAENKKNKTIKKLAKRLPINKESDNKRVLNIIYKILSAELKPLHTKCEGNLPGCTKVVTEIHHMKGRKGLRGLLQIMSKYFKYLCTNCHDFCTEHSKEAKELGLSLPINSITVYEFTDRELELMDKYGVKAP